MIKTINTLFNSMMDNLHSAMPVLLIAIFYQVTILQLPLNDVMEMLGWVLLIIVGLTLGI
ncbi:MAG: hypothetical protein RI964_1931 [Pseudomonadota bacterium]